MPFRAESPHCGLEVPGVASHRPRSVRTRTQRLTALGPFQLALWHTWAMNTARQSPRHLGEDKKAVLHACCGALAGLTTAPHERRVCALFHPKLVAEKGALFTLPTIATVARRIAHPLCKMASIGRKTCGCRSKPRESFMGFFASLYPKRWSTHANFLPYPAHFHVHLM